jgi:hypothetical protein
LNSLLASHLGVPFAFGIVSILTCCASVAGLRIISAGLNFLVVVTLKSDKHMSTKSPECWASDPNARGVKVEVSAERSLLLPFDQFAFAELKTEEKQQHLRLVFATHEVSARGNSLRRIETAMQRMELSFLAALPSSQRSLVADGQPLVAEITATEMPPSAKVA